MNLKNMILKLNVQICEGFLGVSGTDNIFLFMNKYCQDNCYSTLLQVYDSLIVKFDNIKILKLLQIKKTLISSSS